MTERANSTAKVQRPSTHFVDPREVVADPALSNAQKVEALGTLEQDARQLAAASSEGMAGGERNKLHDVLNAKDMLAAPPVADAYETVLRDLRSRQKQEAGKNTRVLLAQAVEALDELVASFATPATATYGPPNLTSRTRREGTA
jgi:hypothetical protein